MSGKAKVAVSNLGRAELEREARGLGVARYDRFSLADLRKAVRRAREMERDHRLESSGTVRTLDQQR